MVGGVSDQGQRSGSGVGAGVGPAVVACSCRFSEYWDFQEEASDFREYFRGAVSRLRAPMLCTGAMRWMCSSIVTYLVEWG